MPQQSSKFQSGRGPEWAKKVVWYQIFPERFRNGNPDSNPTYADTRGAYPHDHAPDWQVHPWTSDWYELQPYEKKNRRSIWFNILRRRYGGDLQGILERLDYLQELGVTALYLNPVFESPSHHKYDGVTYHHVDPTFGPDPGGDRRRIAAETPDDPGSWVWTAADRLFLTLVDEIHRRGMRIIIDGVFNHMGHTSWAFLDVKKHQQRSRYKDWFKVISWDDPQMKTSFEYHGWWGVKELPEFRQDKNGIVEGPRQYIFAATRRWMDPDGDGDPADGIDGWRLDVAASIRHPFWKAWRQWVKSINPEAYLVAEVVDSIAALKPYLEGDEFDALMNYNFAFACAEYFINRKRGIKTSEFDQRLRELREAFPEGAAYLLQNLFDSHDTNRIASHIVNRDRISYRNWREYFNRSKARNPRYITRKPNAEELQIQKLLVIFQMTCLGAPMIYYGDEAGMWGANDPDCRKPMIWEDLQYDPEVYLPDGSRRKTPDTVVFNHDLFRHYQKLIHIRNSCPALQSGDFRTLRTDDRQEIYAFSRTSKTQTVVVVINNSRSRGTLKLPLEMEGEWQDILNGGETVPVKKGMVQLTVEAKWGCILLR